MKVALFIFAKDEDNYLDENLDYNLHLGYDDIFVCQNNWRFKNREAYSGNKRIHFIECDGEAMQNPAYNAFIQENWNKYDFGAFFDTDEFLLLKKHNNIKDFLKEYLDIPAIGLNMRFFGDSFLKFDNKNLSCIKRFVYSDDSLYPLLKVILNFRLCGEKVRFLNPHIPNVPCVDPNKKIVSKNGNMPNNHENEIAELTHYRNKTYDECLKRQGTNKPLPCVVKWMMGSPFENMLRKE